LIVAGCRTGGANPAETGTPDSNHAKFATTAVSPGAAGLGATGDTNLLDRLHVGDALTIELTDTPVPFLPREERIKEDGTITLMENKTFLAAGKTRGQLEQEIHDWYVPRFYLKMTVSVRQKEQTQFYYVRGEVRSPGRQVYIDRMTVLKAIGSAGDFTDFARKSSVQLTRADRRTLTINAKKALADPRLDLEVFPGDTINVPRRNPIF
jgi:polysaccharide export outer membrane protein